MEDLERVSEVNKNYQRDIIVSHKKDIVEFLKTSDYKYFPEITLSYTLNDQVDNAKLSSTLGEILDVTSKKKNRITFSKSTMGFRGKLDSRNRDKLETVTIHIDETELLKGWKPFHRIDGNHRLAAVNEISDAGIKNLPIPFCLILLSGGVNDEKFESVIFHNINSKSEHLTSEENLKALFNNTYFTDEELNKNFSWAYVKARHLLDKLDFTFLESIRNVFKNPLNNEQWQIRTVAVKALEFLKSKKLISKGVSISLLLFHITAVNSIYKSEAVLIESNDDNLFIAFLYYSFKEINGTTQVSAFKNWIILNEIYKIKINNAEGVIEIFDKVLEKKIRIFMAMPYYSSTTVDKYNHVLQIAIDQVIASNRHLNLSKYPIMRERGASMDIVQNLLNNITNCEIFVVDITGNNLNVFFEYGFAHSLNKKIIVVKKHNDSTRVPFDVEHNLRLKYKGAKDLETLLIERIRQTLIQLGFVIKEPDDIV